MPGHLDILDRSDSLNKPLLGSVVLHFAAFGTLVLWGVVVSGPHESWGDPTLAAPAASL